MIGDEVAEDDSDEDVLEVSELELVFGVSSFSRSNSFALSLLAALDVVGFTFWDEWTKCMICDVFSEF